MTPENKKKAAATALSLALQLLSDIAPSHPCICPADLVPDLPIRVHKPLIYVILSMVKAAGIAPQPNAILSPDSVSLAAPLPALLGAPEKRQ